MAEQINDLVIQRALRNVAGQSGMTPQQVRRNIEKMLEESRSCTDPRAKAAWDEIPHVGEVPTMEEVFRYLAERIENQIGSKK